MRKLLLSALITALLVAASVDAQQTRLTILYSNDMHAHVEPQIVPWVDKKRPVGGFANIATLVKQQKKAVPNTAYFDAGDFFTGPYISSLTKGEAIIDAMNLLGIDAACVGNHEFDHGWQNAQLQFKKAKFPILNGNIFLKGTEQLHWNKPYVIVNVGGIRLGVIGLHERFAFYDTTSAEMIQGVEARDEKIYLRKYIKELDPQVDLIVLLTHIGIPGTQSTTGEVDVARNHTHEIALAKDVPGVDLMITGHPHSGITEPLVSNGTIIVSTDAYTIELGKLEITYDKAKDKIVSYKNTLKPLFDDEVPDDPAMVKVLKKWDHKLSVITDEVVTTSSAPMTRSYGAESVMGNMVADAMLADNPGYELAITNSGGLRQDIDAGPVTVGELISAFPFPNTIVQLEMKGSGLRTVFEHGAALTNGITQVSKGVELVYDESRPVGSRIVKCVINGEPLSDEKTYKVLTSNFLADKGDGFSSFGDASFRKNTGVGMLEAMIKYLKRSPRYAPVLEGRIKKLPA